MQFKLRRETNSDYPEIKELVIKAFKGYDWSDQNEYLLVDELRKTDGYIPELSMVALHNDLIVGHIMFSEILFKTEEHEIITALSMAPVSVLPGYHRKGIGTIMITEGHRIARSMNYNTITVLGHPEYYPKFGYETSTKHGVIFPFGAPEEACMVKFLDSIPLAGKLIFPPVFLELG